MKTYRSDTYNWTFNPENGMMVRWGRDEKDDPICSPVGPEILDLEISTICHGPGKPCSFCYKGNTPNGTYMPYKRFMELLEILPPNLTQIAFGIGDIDSNPDLEKILLAARRHDIVPNITINGYRMTSRMLDFLSNVCGSIAVSRYNDDQCFDTVQELTDRGASQVNIHQIYQESNLQSCLSLLEKAKTDSRLSKLNAILFLMIKPKGRARYLQPIQDVTGYKNLVEAALAFGRVGFDSCSAPMVLKAIEDNKDLDVIKNLIEPCEAFLFSSYANVNGEFFPCSFCEGEPGWEKGLPAVPGMDFIRDIWYHPRMIEWRYKLINSSQCKCSLAHLCRSCPIFEITPCKEKK